MNKIIKVYLSLIMSAIFLLTNISFICASPQKENNPLSTSSNASEFRGIWLSFLDFDTSWFSSESIFTDKIDNVFDNIVCYNLTDVIVQIRPFSDALYNSSIFPQSHIMTGIQGKICGFDPLKIMIERAHSKNLKLHAWINPYRIKNPSSTFSISENHPAKRLIDEHNSSEIISLSNGGIYYNPASKNSQKLILDGVKEIIEKYDVDGIHLDDYFYPSTDLTIDANHYNNYLKSGGTLSVNDWRCENVNALIKSIYSSIKAINPKILFGISPAGDIKSNYTTHYSDVKKWLSNVGYIDYLAPQIYYGFKHETHSFDKILNDWCVLPRKSNINLYIGLAAYKIGLTDKFSKSGENEWQTTSHNIISRQILCCRAQSCCQGFILFRYGSIFNPVPEVKKAVNEEFENLKTILK